MAKHKNSPKCLKCQEMLYAYLVDGTLRQWFEDLQAKQPEVHIAFTYRNKADQDKFFREKKTKAKFGQSPHNYLPAMAIDIFFLVDGKYYLDMKWLRQIANDMPKELEWGGNWKMKDGPHFERAGWKSLVKNYPNGNKPNDDQS